MRSLFTNAYIAYQNIQWKRPAVLLLSAFLVLLPACGGNTAEKETETAAETVYTYDADGNPVTRTFTDDLGRTFELPYTISRIAITGPLTQIYTLPVSADKWVGISTDFSEEAAEFIPEDYTGLPLIGQLYGGKGTINLEELIRIDPDFVLDVGEAKRTITDDMDSLTEASEIPFLHIDATVATAPRAYRRIGELLGDTSRTEPLAVFLENTYASMQETMKAVDRKKARKTIVYLIGDEGLNCLAEGSFHAETVNMMGDNVAKLETVVSNGSGNEIDMEQLLLWDPDVIIFGPDSVYDQVGTDPDWQGLTAIREGRYYKTPEGPYNWLGSPPSVQRYLGMLWLGDLLYPEYMQIDAKETIREYYRLFYGYEMTDEKYAEMTADSY